MASSIRRFSSRNSPRILSRFIRFQRALAVQTQLVGPGRHSRSLARKELRLRTVYRTANRRGRANGCEANRGHAVAFAAGGALAYDK